MNDELTALEKAQTDYHKVRSNLATNGERAAAHATYTRSISSLLRSQEEGWIKIGLADLSGRRSLWARLNEDTIELCSGLEGDDEYAIVSKDNPAYYALSEIVQTAIWIAQRCE